MKHAVRIAILLFGLVSLYVSAVPQVAALDGGPISTCPGQRCGLPPA
jgi:hypothetical protein